MLVHELPKLSRHWTHKVWSGRKHLWEGSDWQERLGCEVQPTCTEAPKMCLTYKWINHTENAHQSLPWKMKRPRWATGDHPVMHFVFGQRESSCPALAHPRDFIWPGLRVHSGEKLGKITQEKIMVLWLQEDYWLSSPESVCLSGRGRPQWGIHTQKFCKLPHKAKL